MVQESSQTMLGSTRGVPILLMTLKSKKGKCTSSKSEEIRGSASLKGRIINQNKSTIMTIEHAQQISAALTELRKTIDEAFLKLEEEIRAISIRD